MNNKMWKMPKSLRDQMVLYKYTGLDSIGQGLDFVGVWLVVQSLLLGSRSSTFLILPF